MGHSTYKIEKTNLVQHIKHRIISSSIFKRLLCVFEHVCKKSNAYAKKKNILKFNLYFSHSSKRYMRQINMKFLPVLKIWGVTDKRTNSHILGKMRQNDTGLQVLIQNHRMCFKNNVHSSLNRLFQHVVGKEDITTCDNLWYWQMFDSKNCNMRSRFSKVIKVMKQETFLINLYVYFWSHDTSFCPCSL